MSFGGIDRTSNIEKPPRKLVWVVVGRKSENVQHDVQLKTSAFLATRADWSIIDRRRIKWLPFLNPLITFLPQHLDCRAVITVHGRL
jgi:hypothetical protein